MSGETPPGGRDPVRFSAFTVFCLEAILTVSVVFAGLVLATYAGLLDVARFEDQQQFLLSAMLFLVVWFVASLVSGVMEHPAFAVLTLSIGVLVFGSVLVLMLF